MAIISRQLGHSPTDKLYQKIDLAITEEQRGSNASEHERTLVGIELKGINKNEVEIIRDAERLANAMMLKDKIGSNSINFCFCGFLRRLDKSDFLATKDYIRRKMEEEKNHWNEICDGLNKKHTLLNFSTQIFEIINTPFEVVSDIHEKMESDFSEVANDTGIIVGGILTIERIS